MANNEQLKTAIAAVIKQNGNEEITGQIMQSALLSIINQFGTGSIFAGTATPETTPGTPDVNTFYIASKPGVYSNFGGAAVTDKLTVFSNETGTWAATVLDAPNFEFTDKVDKTIASSNGGINKLYAAGYVNTSGGITVGGDIEKYKYVLFPVLPGEKYLINSDRSNELNAFMINKTTQLSRFTTVVGENIVTVPTGCNYMALTLEYTPGGGAKVGDYKNVNITLVTPFIQSLLNARTTAANNETVINSEFKKSKNLFDKDNVKTGVYINTTSGALQGEANSAVSNDIPVDENTIYFLSGREGGNISEIRFKNASGGLLKPIDATTGIERTSYTISPRNGAVKSPPGAVSCDFTIKLVGVGNYDFVQFEKGSSQTDYVPYGYYIEDVVLANEKADEAIITANNANDKIDAFTSGGVFVRLNTGENTDTPQYFGNSAGGTNAPKIELVNDLELPFYDVLPYKRIMSYPLQTTPSSIFASQKLTLGSSRPEKITISYWTKESDLRTFFENPSAVMQIYLSLGVYGINIINLLNNIGTKQTFVINPTTLSEYSRGELTAYVSAKVDDYVNIVQEFVVEWKETFIGNGIDYYFIFNTVVPKMKANDFTVYNFTYLFGDVNRGVLVYGDPAGSFGQMPQNLKSIENQIETINQKVEGLDNDKNMVSRAQIIGNNLYFATPFSQTMELCRVLNVKRSGSFSENPNVNFVQTNLISKGGALNTGSAVKGSGDDICPAHLNGSYIGGNHGWAHAKNLLKTAHGKTFADIGSRWKDSNNVMFTILRIVDENNIWICSDNQNSDGYGYSFVSPSTNLTYVSDGENTGAISGFTISGIGNLYNTIILNNRKILIDGVNDYIENGGVTECSFVDIVEDYDALDLPTVLQSLTSNRPSGGYTQNVQLNSIGGEKLINHNITYRLLSNGTTLVIHNFLAYKKYNLTFHGFIQSGAISGNLYVPKVLPISDGVKNWDFRTVEQWNPYPATALLFTSQYWENPTSPPDRILNFNSNINFHIGYLFDRGVGKLRRENPTDWLERSIFLNTTGKLYPYGVYKGGVNMEAGTWLSCVAFRSFTNPANNPLGRLNYSYFELDGKVYIYLDYNGNIQDSIKLQSSWNGKKIVINEKTDNVQVLGDVAVNELKVNCIINESNIYGYCVIILE